MTKWPPRSIVKFIQLISYLLHLVSSRLVFELEFSLLLVIFIDDILKPVRLRHRFNLLTGPLAHDLFLEFVDFLGLFAGDEFEFGIEVAMEEKIIAEGEHTKFLNVYSYLGQ